MTTLAPLLQSFFTERLAKERQASPHTICAYKTTFSLLLRFARDRLGKNSVRTRNARLAAIHSFFHYIAVLVPDYAGQIRRVLDIPHKRFDRRLVDFLSRPEFEALLGAPDRRTWIGRRNHALLLVAIQTGLRASELANLRIDQIVPGKHPHIRCTGKGRKERCTPLTRQTMDVLRAWLREQGGTPGDPVFPSSRGGVLSLDALEKMVKKYAVAAAQACPSLREKRVTPHVLRHTAAMQLRHAGVDLSTMALWLGHESIETTQIYLQSDLASREEAVSRLAPPSSTGSDYSASRSRNSRRSRSLFFPVGIIRKSE